MTSKKKSRGRGTPLSRTLRGQTKRRAVVIGETMLVLSEARTVVDCAAEGLKDWLHPVEWDNLRVLSSGMYRILRMLEVLLARNLGRVLADPIHIALPCEVAVARLSPEELAKCGVAGDAQAAAVEEEADAGAEKIGGS